MITSCPALMPALTTPLARPALSGKARVTISDTGVIEATPLPIANTTP